MNREQQRLRWIFGAALVVWSLSHASVFAQDKDKEKDTTPKFSDRFAEKLYQDLERNISLDYQATCLQDAVEYLRDKTKVNFSYDMVTLMQLGLLYGENSPPPAVAAVQLKSSRMPARQAIQRFLNRYGLTYVILDDTVLITTEEEGMARLLRQRISLDVKDKPLYQVFKELSQEHNLGIVLDPRETANAQVPITIQLSEISMETTVRLLAEFGNLKPVRVGSVLLVTNEQRAFRLRQDDEVGSHPPPILPQYGMPPNGMQSMPPGGYISPSGPTITAGPPGGFNPNAPGPSGSFGPASNPKDRRGPSAP